MDIEEEEAENRKFYGQNMRNIGGPSGTMPATAEVTAIKNRRFSNLGKPLSKVFEKLKAQGLLEPLEPKPVPNLVPHNLDLSLYCHFHQRRGHEIDSCTRLRHEIQNLIDSRKIPDPEKEQPNTHKNPLPNYHSVPPPIYMINSGLPESFILQNLKHSVSPMEMEDDNGEEP